MTDAPRGKRPRRFALPEHDDHRAVHTIDALIGPHPKPEPDAHAEERGRGRAASRTVYGGLDSRLSFIEAARREDERVRRYRRPAAVAVMSVASSSRNGTGARAVERGTWWLIEAATATLRETDRVARFGPGRLHVLLPETRGRQAERVVERIRERWAERAGIAGASEVVLRIAVAAVPTTGGVDDAFRRAEATTTPNSPGTPSTTRSSGSEVAETASEHPGTPESTPSSAPDPTA